MRYLSLFSGVEAASLAWEPLGWQPVAFSEIEPFPCAVLAERWPSVPNLGDVTQITESTIKKLGPVDIVVFGSPCQDLSICGRREGLNGQRSGLFRNAIQIIRWCRKHCGTRFALWENVPGGLSSNNGADFQEVIRLLSGARIDFEKWRNAGLAIGKEGLVEWRVLDAQFFGVPQQRRRVFAFAHFGDWSDREPVLFESTVLPRCVEAREKNAKANSIPIGDDHAVESTNDRVIGTITTNSAYFAGHDVCTNLYVYAPGDDVRRLTPLELERAQGMPDHHTLIQYRGKPATDEPRCKAIGNSIAVPVLKWVGKRIEVATFMQSIGLGDVA
ncbi:DNA cytosine methyltransferase [Algicola sagamiensis]|uniref:DNA cytosine methyltransferase n=1 Tax=Algicola sagamiensis TaxID=163869 RepID=UPI00037B1267|nr:DNA cytosine methyltransferase [Algicola sagamiensis]